MGGPQRGGEPVRVTRLFQQFARLSRIVGPRLVALGVGNRRRHDAGSRGGVAGEGDLHQRLAVDGVVDRFAHFRIIKRLLRHVEADVALHN